MLKKEVVFFVFFLSDAHAYNTAWLVEGGYTTAKPNRALEGGQPLISARFFANIRI